MSSERPLDATKQAILDELDSFQHPNMLIVTNGLSRGAGFTTLLCGWLARKSHSDVINLRGIGRRETQVMTGMITAAGGDMTRCHFAPDAFAVHERATMTVHVSLTQDLVSCGKRHELVRSERVIINTETPTCKVRKTNKKSKK